MEVRRYSRPDEIEGLDLQEDPCLATDAAARSVAQLREGHAFGQAPEVCFLAHHRDYGKAPATSDRLIPGPCSGSSQSGLYNMPWRCWGCLRAGSRTYRPRPFSPSSWFRSAQAIRRFSATNFFSSLS